MIKKVIKRFSELEDMFSKDIKSLKRNNKPIPRRESLLLYRQVLKFSREFYWLNERGEEWGDKIRKSARSEFEAARFEKDPFLIGQMIVTSKDAINKVREKLIKKYDETNKQLINGDFVFKEDRNKQRNSTNTNAKDENRDFMVDKYND